MILRPYGIVINGQLELGLELVMEGPRIAEVRPHTGIPELYVISPAFVNAHSHLEYRGLQGKLQSETYWPWIREITEAKTRQSPEQVRQDCHLAARENRATGVALIAEHSDRPFAGEAMAGAGLRGVIFQEVITFNEMAAPTEKLAKVQAAADQNKASFGGPVHLNPHAYYTVGRGTLTQLAAGANPLSIHAAETELESQFTRNGAGPIAELYQRFSIPFETTGKSVARTLIDLGFARTGVQWVHCCDLSADEIEALAGSGITVAHCARSNLRLKCPPAPVREMLDSGLAVGLGLDSPASSGPIDMFSEMRAALDVSTSRGRPLSPEEVWNMATTTGAASLPIAVPPWQISPCAETPLIKLHIGGACNVAELIEQGSPDVVEWV